MRVAGGADCVERHEYYNTATEACECVWEWAGEHCEERSAALLFSM